MAQQINIFEGHIPYYKITKPVRLIELFAGIGSQHQALKNLGVKIDNSTIVEWQVNSIQAYNDIHVRKYDDHTQNMSKEDVANSLAQYGVSIDYNQPAKLESLLRKSDEWLRNVYNNVINTNNKVNIMSVKGSDLNVVDTDKYDYIITYSFPCQDLSKAGKGKGMSDTSTRSGLLWEVERILTEMKEKPQVLLMENVPDVIGTRYISDFRIWEERLRELGYSNHIEILNSKDYGIPQNRQRAFMVSILGDYLYEFPQKQELTLRLKDMLEKEVDEKYYLTTEKIEAISQWKAQQDPLENMEYIDKTGISPTLTARGAGEEHSGMVLIKEDTNLGYALAHEGDGVYINRPEQKRGVVQKQMIQTIKANSNDVGVVVNKPNLRIRKLTPIETWRLMGFSDEAFDLAQPNQSNSSLYHQAGDSIVVNVLEALFKELL
jgi:DNA (cytosine-5)-methyltransferase 1